MNCTLTQRGYFRLFVKIWDGKICGQLFHPISRMSKRRTGSRCVETSPRPATIWTTISPVNLSRMIPKGTKFTDISIFLIIALGKSWVRHYPKMYACGLASYCVFVKTNKFFGHTTVINDWNVYFMNIFHSTGPLRVSVLMSRGKSFVWRLNKLPKLV